MKARTLSELGRKIAITKRTVATMKACNIKDPIADDELFALEAVLRGVDLEAAASDVATRILQASAAGDRKAERRARYVLQPLIELLMIENASQPNDTVSE